MNTQKILITGDDSYEIYNYSKKLIQKFIKEEKYTLIEHKIDSENNEISEKITQFINNMQSLSFFTEKEILLLTNLEYKRSQNLDENLTLISEIIKKESEGEKVIIISGTNLEEAKSIYEAFKEYGQVKILNKIDCSQKNWRQAIQSMIKEKAKNFKLSLNYDIIEYLIEYFANNTSVIDAELQKLKLISFSEPLSLDIIRKICKGNNSVVFWDLANALQRKQKNLALQIISNLLRKEVQSQSIVLSLLKNISKRFTLLLEAQIIAHKLKKNRSQRFNNSQLNEKEKSTYAHLTWTKQSTYYSQKIFESSFNFKPKEILNALKMIEQAYQNLLYTKASPKIILEKLTLDILN